MDWQEVESEIKALTNTISDKPEIIVAVVRGGIVPARLLAKFLGVTEMYALTIAKLGAERVVRNTIDRNLSGKKVLIVEDVLESGTSLIAAKTYIESPGGEVKTASLYSLPKSQIKPDYSLGGADSVPQFPWD